MKSAIKQRGFSLAEVLMAVGILSIGLMLIATMFPVALYMTTVASERTMAAIVSDEAFAKIQLYGINSYPPGISDYNNISRSTPIDPNEYSYPSVDPCMPDSRQYYWSALCKKTDPNFPQEYQVTVFVARKTSPSHTYYGGGEGGKRPKVITVNVVLQTDANELQISGGNAKYVNPPTTIIHNVSGRLYRIVDRTDNKVRLDRRWDKDTVSPNGSTDPNSYIWLIPPPVSGGKNADIEVYGPRTIKF